MGKIFDSHAHYDDEKFETDRQEVLDGLFSDKVCGIINCGCDLKSSLKEAKLTSLQIYYELIKITGYAEELLSRSDFEAKQNENALDPIV